MHLKRQRRVRYNFRPTSLELLEDRKLLSGNVLAVMSPTTGALVITGDTGNNRITIAPSPIAGDIRVSGNVVLTPPTGFDITTVNSVAYTDFVASSLTSISITMQNGVVSPLGVQPNHSITIENLAPGIPGSPSTVPGNLTINGGTANDTISILNYTTTGQIVINEASAAANSDNISLTNVSSGLDSITTGAGSDVLTLNGGKVGNMILNTGSGGNDKVTISNFPSVGGVSGIGLLSLTTPSNGNNVINVSNSSVTTGTVTADGTGNNTVNLNALTFLNGATVNATGAGNNNLSFTNSTAKSVALSSGTGNNVININSDTLTGTSGTTLSLTTGGTGANTYQIISVNNDTLSGGNATIKAGDGPQYAFPPTTNLPLGYTVPLAQTSQFALNSDTGIGTATVTLGNNFRYVTVGDTAADSDVAKALTVNVGTGSNIDLLNTKVAGAESITVGDLQNIALPGAPTVPGGPNPLLLANSFILNGTAGTLNLSVGANAATFQQNAIVAGTETVSVGANAGAVTILRPTAGNSTITIGANAAGPIHITGNDTGGTAPVWIEQISIGNNAGAITVNGTLSGNQTIGVGNSPASLNVSTTVESTVAGNGNQVITVTTLGGPVTVSSAVTGTQSVTVGSYSGTGLGSVTITGSAASANYTVGDNTALTDSATTPGAVNIVGTTGDTVLVNSTTLGSLNVSTPGANDTITVQGPLVVTNGGVTITSGTGATVLVDSVNAVNDPSGNGVVINTGNGAVSVQVSNTTATALTVNNGNGNTFLALYNDALGLGSVTPAMGLILNSGSGNNTLFMSNITVSNGLMIGFGSGVNTVYSADVVADFGFIDGGSSGANVFYDAGGNSGFYIFDFVGY